MSVDLLEELGFETDTPESACGPGSDGPARKPSRTRPGAIWSWIAVAAAAGVAVLAAFVLTASVVAPEWTNQMVGDAQVAAEQLVTGATGGTPTVVLGGQGGQAEIDRCDGTFVRLAEFAEVHDLQPTYSAHNGCGGNAILPLGIGDVVDVVGEDGVVVQHEVVDVRNVPQRTSTTEDVKGMGGEILVQTCYWDDRTMKFTGLAPVV